jgi:hypothetical protein
LGLDRPWRFDPALLRSGRAEVVLSRIGHHGRMLVYRYRPFLVLVTVVQVIVVVMIAATVGHAAARPDISTVCGAVAVVSFLGASLVGLGTFWKHRTVIDATGVTQHWVVSTYRMPFDQITGVEDVFAGRRWFLRVYCGERTFEVIPCQLYLPTAIGAPRPPRVMAEVRAAIEQSLPVDRVV